MSRVVAKIAPSYKCGRQPPTAASPTISPRRIVSLSPLPTPHEPHSLSSPTSSSPSPHPLHRHGGRRRRAPRLGRRSGGAGVTGHCGHLCEGTCWHPAQRSPRCRSGEGGGGPQRRGPARCARSGDLRRGAEGGGRLWRGTEGGAGSGEAHEVEKVEKVEAGSGEEQAEQKVSAYHFNVVVFRL